MLKFGLALSVLLALADIVGVAGIGMENAPPPALIITAGTLGVVTLVAVALIRRKGAVLTVIVSRILSALLGLPAFILEAPQWARIVVAIGLVLTVAAVALVAAGRRTALT